jgi:DNA-binding MarR family transcriptional regulator
MKTEEKIVESIFNLSRTIREHMMSSCKTYHFTLVQLHVLLMLKKEKHIKMTDVANSLKIALPTATSILDKLVSADLVSRKADENDRRNVILSLTEKGKDMLEKGMKARKEMMKKMLSNLSEDEKSTILNAMTKLINNYEK